MTNTHKRQHTVPRSYLSSWIEPYTPPGQTSAVHLISKADRLVKRKSPEKTFTETDRYTVHLKDGSRNLAVENYLGSIESDFQGVLRTIREGHPLGRVHRAKLATFTAAMLGRSKPHGDHILGQFQNFQKHLAEMEGKVSAKPTTSEDLGVYLKDYPAKHVVQIIQTAAPILFSMALTICTTDDVPGFITSDTPAVMFNPESYKFPPQYQSPGLMQTDIEVRMPLTPRHLALYTHRSNAAAYLPLSGNYVEEVNRTAWHVADQFIISKTGEIRPFWFSERSRPSDAWDSADVPHVDPEEGNLAAEIVAQFKHAKAFHDSWRRKVYLPGSTPE